MLAFRSPCTSCGAVLDYIPRCSIGAEIPGRPHCQGLVIVQFRSVVHPWRTSWATLCTPVYSFISSCAGCSARILAAPQTAAFGSSVVGATGPGPICCSGSPCAAAHASRGACTCACCGSSRFRAHPRASTVPSPGHSVAGRQSRLVSGRVPLSPGRSSLFPTPVPRGTTRRGACGSGRFPLCGPISAPSRSSVHDRIHRLPQPRVEACADRRYICGKAAVPQLHNTASGPTLGWLMSLLSPKKAVLVPLQCLPGPSAFCCEAHCVSGGALHCGPFPTPVQVLSCAMLANRPFSVRGAGWGGRSKARKCMLRE